MISYDDLLVSGKLSQEDRLWQRALKYLPSDKSISHRMILFAALAEHQVSICNVNEGRAVTLLVDALAKLGISCENDREQGTLRVDGCLRDIDPNSQTRIDFGPSSAAARLMIGVLCGLGFSECVVDGDETLRARPFDWIVEPLSALGGHFEYLEEFGSLPIRLLRGQFSGGSAKTKIGSAQAVSALLFAGISSRKAVTVDFPVFARNHTQIMARSFGDDVEEVGNSVQYNPGNYKVPYAVSVPGDPSAAAYLAAFFWMSHRSDAKAELRLSNQCLNPSRLGFFYWMQQCGFGLELQQTGHQCGEDVGDIVLRGGGEQTARNVSGGRMVHSMIDEIPLVAAIACQLPGNALFEDLEELTFKETNRISATCDMLKTMGLSACEAGHRILINGGNRPTTSKLVPSFGDHRLSMTACVTLLCNDLTAIVGEGKCYRTSFPEFGAMFATLLGEG